MKLINKVAFALGVLTVIILFIGLLSLSFQYYRLAGLCFSGFFLVLALYSKRNKKLSGFGFSFWVLSGLMGALFFPEYFRTIGSFDLKKLIIPLLQIIMFGMGTTIGLKDFIEIVKMPKAVTVGIICQFTIMPAVGLILASLFHLPSEIAAGIILVGSSPSGLASNVMSYLAKANVALSVTLTIIATLIAPLMTPLLMKVLAGQLVPVDFWPMMISIFEMVIIPIFAGLIFNKVLKNPFSFQKKSGSYLTLGISLMVFSMAILVKFFLNLPEVVHLLTEIFWILGLSFSVSLIFRKFLNHKIEILKFMPVISMVGITIIIVIITAAGREDLLKVGGVLILACLIHNIAGYILGYFSCRMIGLDKNSCKTIALEVGMQNSGLASGIAQEMGRLATLGLAPAIFGPMMNITGSTLASYWGSKKMEN